MSADEFHTMKYDDVVKKDVVNVVKENCYKLFWLR